MNESSFDLGILRAVLRFEADGARGTLSVYRSEGGEELFSLPITNDDEMNDALEVLQSEMESAPPEEAAPAPEPEEERDEDRKGLLDEQRFGMWLATIADDASRVRPVDVPRVMEYAEEAGKLEAFRAWLLDRPELPEAAALKVMAWKNTAGVSMVDEEAPRAPEASEPEADPFADLEAELNAGLDRLGARTATPQEPQEPPAEGGKVIPFPTPAKPLAAPPRPFDASALAVPADANHKGHRGAWFALLRQTFEAADETTKPEVLKAILGQLSYAAFLFRSANRIKGEFGKEAEKYKAIARERGWPVEEAAKPEAPAPEPAPAPESAPAPEPTRNLPPEVPSLLAEPAPPKTLQAPEPGPSEPVEPAREEDESIPHTHEPCEVLNKILARIPADRQQRADLWTARQREEANLCAMSVASDRLQRGTLATVQETEVLKRYSGWGGLSIDKNAPRFPPGFPVPQPAGLIHEYYTPSAVAAEVVRVLTPMLPMLPKVLEENEIGISAQRIVALEPSAGIGRFVRAGDDATGEGAEEWRKLKWVAVEMSEVSGTMLRLIRPDMDLTISPFEAWVQENGPRMMGKFGLVLSNPPYGERGMSSVLDDHRGYRDESEAWAYFLRRTFDLLAPGGVGVYVIPGGFLTGKGDMVRGLRTRMLKRGHLLEAFRLPSKLFPGALLVVDVLFFQARAGTLKEILDSDKEILEGRYFKQFPANILGTEQGEEHPNDTNVAKAPQHKFSYQVIGEFVGLPDLNPRPMGTGEYEPVKQSKTKGPRKLDIPVNASEGAREALALGARVSDYFASTPENMAMAHGELRDAMLAWVKVHGSPRKHSELRALVEEKNQDASRFYAQWAEGDVLVESLGQKPEYVTPYRDDPESLSSLLPYCLRRNKKATLAFVVSEYVRLGGKRTAEETLAWLKASLPSLYVQGWRLHGAALDRVDREEDYLAGYLWTKYDQLGELLKDQPSSVFQEGKAHGSLPLSTLEAQRASLYKVMGVVGYDHLVTFEEKEGGIKEEVPLYSPRQEWVGLDLLLEWLATPSMLDTIIGVKLTRRDGVVVVDGNRPDGEEWTYEDHERIKWGGAGSVGADDQSRIWTSVMAWLSGDRSRIEPDEKKAQKLRDAKVKVALEEAARNGIFYDDDGLQKLRGKLREEAKDELLEAMTEEWVKSFKVFIEESDQRRMTLADRYSRAFKGRTPGRYSSEPLPIVRWTTGFPKLRPHQCEGARRVLENRSGLVAFDVGVGKTYTGCAIIAMARQEGWCRRPVVLVPNTVVWNWVKEFEQALPDFRPVVIGSQREKVTVNYSGGKRRRARKGVEGVEVEVGRNDTREERTRKWQDFKMGRYDVAICAYSVFSKTRMNLKELVEYIRSVAPIMAEIEAKFASERRGGEKGDDYWQKNKEKARKSLDAAIARRRKTFETAKAKLNERFSKGKMDKETYNKLLSKLQYELDEAVSTMRGNLAEDSKYNEEIKDQVSDALGVKRKVLATTKTERQEAIRAERIARLIAENLESISGTDPVYWNELGVDLLVVDEAQNFKNLYMGVPGRGGEIPKYMGSAKDGSMRAWQLDFRCRAVRKLHGVYDETEEGKTEGDNAGVVLLSATPAKNSPMEFFNLLQFCDHNYWKRQGLGSPPAFQDYFIRVQARPTVVGGSLVPRDTVTGFSNTDVLREMLTRMGNFKTAEEVGIPLPQPTVNILDTNGEAITSQRNEKGELIYTNARGETVSAWGVGIAMTQAQRDDYNKHREWMIQGYRERSKPEGRRKMSIAKARMGLISVHPQLPYYGDEKTVLDEKGDALLVVGPGGKAIPKKEKAPDPKTLPVELANVGKIKVLVNKILQNLGCSQVVLGASDRLDEIQQGLIKAGVEAEEILMVESEEDFTELSSFKPGRARAEDDRTVMVTTPELHAKMRNLPVSCAVYASTDTASDLEDATRNVLLTRTCGHIVFVENVAMHDWIKRSLIHSGVPADTIAIMNADTTDTVSRQSMAEDFNGSVQNRRRPVYDVLIANSVAYEGINLQTRTCAIHHLDLPWEPATLQQRNGRGVRQGNIRGTIEINYYMTAASFDGLKFGYVMGKHGWMKAVFESQDRLTNNPAASMETNDSDVALMMCGSEEEAKAYVEGLKEQEKARQVERAVALATSYLQTASWAFAVARNLEAEGVNLGEAATKRKEGEDALAQLSKINPAHWPWFNTVKDVVRSSEVYVLRYGIPCYPGMRLHLPAVLKAPEGDPQAAPVEVLQERWVEFGKWKATMYRLPAIRYAQSAKWLGVDEDHGNVVLRVVAQTLGVVALGGVLVAPPDVETRVNPSNWPEDDESIARNEYLALFKSGGYLGAAINWWFDFGLAAAPDRTAREVFEALAPKMLERVKGDRYNASWAALKSAVPMLNDGKVVLAERAEELTKGRILAPTVEDWRVYLEALKETESSRITWTEADKASRLWWSRETPTGTIAYNIRLRKEASLFDQNIPKLAFQLARDPYKDLEGGFVTEFMRAWQEDHPGDNAVEERREETWMGGKRMILTSVYIRRQEWKARVSAWVQKLRETGGYLADNEERYKTSAKLITNMEALP